MEWFEFINMANFILWIRFVSDSSILYIKRIMDWINSIDAASFIMWLGSVHESIIIYINNIMDWINSINIISIMEYIDYMRDYIASYNQEIMYFSYCILALGLFQNFTYFIQIPLAAIELLRMKMRPSDEHTWWLLTSDITMPVSILIPAYNEEVTIVETVTSALATQYPSFEVIVSNDDSSDDTLGVLIKEFDLTKTERFYETKLEHKEVRGIYTSSIYKNLIVIDKYNGGRSDALNTAIDVARNPLCCTLDADSLLDPSALLKTIQPFIDKPDKMMATGGTVRIMNGCDVEYGIVKEVALPTNILALFQIVEYIRAFLMGRLAWSNLGIVTIISGAFAVFRREMVIEVGGFNTTTIGEDFELVMKIHQHCLKNKIDYEMNFVPEPVCWTEVPESLSILSSQRTRWQQGGLEVFFRHRDMFLNPIYGRIGMFAYPMIFIFDVIGPIAEMTGYILLPIFYFLGAINYEFMIALLCLFFVLGIFISMMSLVLEEMSLRRFASAKDLMVLGLVSIIENFGYRQYNNVWRIIGWWRFIRKKQQWGKMTRVGSKKK